MTTRQKQFAIGIVVTGIVIASGGFGYYYGLLPTDQTTSPANDNQIQDVTVYPASSGNGDSVTPKIFEAVITRQLPGYERQHSYSGTVRTALRTSASFQRNGLITRIFVDDGQQVSEGQPLAELDKRHLTAQRMMLDARLDQARALLAELRKGPRAETIAAAIAVVEDLTQQYQGSKLKQERSETLVQSNSISQQDYEQQLYETRALEARLKNAQSQLDELQAGTRVETIEAQESLTRSIESELQAIQYQLDDCLLTAPFSGMVVARMVDPGAVVSAGTPVLELIDPRHLEVHIGIPRGIAERVHPGQTYTVHVGPHVASATLRAVLPELDSTTQTRRAVFDLPIGSEKPAKFVDGQLAQIDLPDYVDDPGFWIPATSITSDHSGLWSCLTLEPFIEADQPDKQDFNDRSRDIEGTARKQSVEVLHQVDNRLFVRGTLKDRQILISSGIHRLVAGQTIVARVSVDQSQPRIETGNGNPVFTSQVPDKPVDSRD